MICLRMGKTNTAKSPPSNFKVTTPEIPLLSQQAVTSKGISVPYSNLQLNPYPNTQLDLFYSDNFSFWCTAPNTWLTNCKKIPVTDFNHQLEKVVGCKVFQFIPMMKIHKILVTKSYGAQTQQLLHMNDELGQTLSLVTICLNKLCSITCATCEHFDGP